MSPVAFVTDSTVNMPPEMAAAYGIHVLPVYVIFGEESLKDYEEIPPEAFYRRLAEYKQATGKMPTTSQPPPDDFRRLYLALADQGYTDIISVHVTAKASGTCQSAEIAAQAVAEQVRVHVVDSESTSMQMGFMLLNGEEAVRQGGGVAEALAAIEATKARSCLYFTVTEVEHLAASGRTQGAETATQAAVQVKPVVGLLDGVPKAVATERTYRGALKRVLSLVQNRAQGAAVRRLAVVHGGIEAKAREWAPQAAAALGFAGEPLVVDFGPALAVHFGPGLLGVAVEWETA